jgi:hypothetical protein
MTTYLSIVIEKELDDIVFEEYGYTYHEGFELNEAKDDDGKYETPVNRGLSFPARAIRYKKAKNIMARYAKKIIKKSEGIIEKFESELNKSIVQIKKRGLELTKQLEKARAAGNETEEKAAINQQKKFKSDVELNQAARIQNLNQSVDNLIGAYTNGINKRIDEPGYVLKVELSDKGKADLKFFWEEHVALIRQQIYEKLIKIINHKNVKGLETLIAKLEVEIEDAEDKRMVVRRSRQGIYRDDKKEALQKQRDQMRGGKNKVEGGLEEPEQHKPETEGPKNIQVAGEHVLSDEDFDKLYKFLDEDLPEGIQKENEPYRVSYKDKEILHSYDAYLQIKKDTKEIMVALYKIDQVPEDDEALKEFAIDDMEQAENFVDAVEAGEEARGFEEKDVKAEKYAEVISDYLEILFKTKKKRIVDSFSYGFYNDFKGAQRIQDFSHYMASEILDNPKHYAKFLKLLQNESFTDQQLILLMLKFKEGYEKSLKESFFSLRDYVKHHL